MDIKIISYTQNPIEVIYKSYRTCYSKDTPTNINIPMQFNPYSSVANDIPDESKMIDFIVAHIDHESPLEHVSLTFSIEGISRICEQQLTRHRLASYSVQSGRYVDKSNSNVVIPNKISENLVALNEFKECINICKDKYNKLIKLGIPKEDARYLLPQGSSTNLICSMNVREFRHFVSERICVKAQKEIRYMAIKMLLEAKKKLSFIDYKTKKCNVTCFSCKDGK